MQVSVQACHPRRWEGSPKPHEWRFLPNGHAQRGKNDILPERLQLLLPLYPLFQFFDNFRTQTLLRLYFFTLIQGRFDFVKGGLPQALQQCCVSSPLLGDGFIRFHWLQRHNSVPIYSF
jgi:hypothetical protein